MSVRPGLIWINGLALLTRRFRHLQLARYAGPDQELDLLYPKVQVSAFTALPYLYDRLAKALWNDGWAPLVCPYDWRKDIEHTTVGHRLKDLIQAIGSAVKPVHIVTHSQGALVARWALWKLACELGPGAARSLVGKIILLGPATYGSFVVALAVAGSLDQIPVCKLFPRPGLWVQSAVASFTAFYQLMPWNPALTPSLLQEDSDVRDPDFWTALSPAEIDCDRLARSFPGGGKPCWSEAVDTTRFNDRITVVLGSHRSPTTAAAVRIQRGRLEVTKVKRGDGWVPDELAIIPGTQTRRVRGVGHILLPTDGRVIRIVRETLAQP
jgi:pimeloyl-ACP methyl ester carboxylesterase